MKDQDKIERVKEIVSEWALDDEAQGGAAIDAIVEIMDVLDFNPYPAESVA